ncbi:MAG: hypothetical protein ACJBCI_07775 [Candidatus Tisiphia sp.]|jgi:hypothetical protein|uniref:hypothetical protein n=1 Tax=Candidatus Tisiphia endosymbiont of Melanophora roralis TaxID=3066261 RepID=UPI001E6BC37E|nr:MAG: hypothetical protein LF884_00360 [Rickettsia endosymbiont of Cimex lectularius]
MKDRKEIEPYMAYKPTQVYNVLKDLSRKQGYTLSAETYENPGNPENKINYYLKNDNNYITVPSHDAQKGSTLTTTAAPLKDTLGVLNQNPNWKKAIIPICQSNKYFFGLLTRKHFTYLELNKDNAGNITSHHQDSKGWLSRFYPLKPIRDSLEETFGKDRVTFKSSYLGHQKIADNINCGRFILSYIKNVITGDPAKNKINPQTQTSLFSDFDTTINKPPKEEKILPKAKVPTPKPPNMVDHVSRISRKPNNPARTH